MNHFWNIVKKELKELLTFGSIMSILVVVIILMSIGTMMSGEIEKQSSLSPLGVINGDYNDEGVVGEYADFSVEWITDNYKGDLHFFSGEYTEENIINQMKSAGINSAIGFPKGYSQSIIDNVANTTETKYTTIDEYFILSEGGGISSISSSVSTMYVISGISAAISIELIKDLGNVGNPVVIHNPIGIDKNNSYTYINGTLYQGITPAEISSATMSQNMMVPMIIMMIIMMIGSIIISSMGNEKENKTLETLLTLPVKRTTIVSGKLIACAITGLIFGIAQMIGMYFYMNGMMGSMSDINLADYGLALTGVDWIITGIMVFMAILCALGICMIMGAFVKNYKSAQTMTLPLAVLAMIPMFVTMFSSWGALPTILQGVLFAIPFTHPMMVIPNLTFGNDLLVISGLIYLIIFTLIALYITVRLYNSDILITGLGQNKFVKKITGLTNGKKHSKHSEK